MRLIAKAKAHRSGGALTDAVRDKVTCELALEALFGLLVNLVKDWLR